MRTVRAVGDPSIAIAVASMPERFRLTDDRDADLVLAAPHALDDDRAILALRFAPCIDVEPATDAALVQVTVERVVLEELDALVEALAVARRLVGASLDSIEVLHRTSACIVASAGATTLTCVRSATGRDALHARVVGRDRRVDIDLDATAPAHPGRIAVFDATGERVAAPVHQSGHRLTLQRAADGLEPLYAVSDLRHDLGLVRSVL